MKRLILIAAAGALAVACSPDAQSPATETAGGMSSAGSKMAQGYMAEGKMGMMVPAAGDTEATRGFKAAMMAQIEVMPAFGGNADVDFMKQMRGHHQAAIAMARVELAQGQNPQAKALAQEIITAQQREIGVIDTWLTANGG